MIKVLNIFSITIRLFLRIECPPPKIGKKIKKSLLSPNCNITMTKSKMQNLIFIIVLNYNGWLVEFTAL